MPIRSAIAAASCASGVEEGALAADRGVLLQQNDPGSGDDRPPPFVGVDERREAFEKRGLAGAVAADEREPVALPDIDVEIAEQPAFTLNKAEIFVREDGGCHAAQLGSEAREVTPVSRAGNAALRASI
jgi:hypothetical protein